MYPTTKTCDISTLNGLVSICRDAASAYREASSLSRNVSLSKLFRARSLERDMLVQRMQAHIALVRGSDIDLSLHRPAHSMVLDVHAMIGDSVEAAIREVESGERAIDAAFEAAMNDPGISASLQLMIMGWYTRIFQGQEEVTALKQSIS